MSIIVIVFKYTYAHARSYTQVLPSSQFVCPILKIQLFKGTLFIVLSFI